MALIEKHFGDNSTTAVVYTHKTLVHAEEYLSDFGPTNTKFITYDPSGQRHANHSDPHYLIINDYYNSNYPNELKNAIKEFRLGGVQVELVERRGLNRLYRIAGVK